MGQLRCGETAAQKRAGGGATAGSDSAAGEKATRGEHARRQLPGLLRGGGPGCGRRERLLGSSAGSELRGESRGQRDRDPRATALARERLAGRHGRAVRMGRTNRDWIEHGLRGASANGFCFLFGENLPMKISKESIGLCSTKHAASGIGIDAHYRTDWSRRLCDSKHGSGGAGEELPRLVGKRRLCRAQTDGRRLQ